MPEHHWITESKAGIRKADQTIRPEDRTYWNFSGSVAVGPDIRSYESWWSMAFGDHVLTKFLEERISEGITPVAIDLAGGNGEALYDLRTSGLIGAGLTSNLTDTRSANQKKEDKQLHLTLAPGDIFLGSTWRKHIYPWVKANTEAGYVDLIMARPGGMFRNIMPAEAYLAVFRRMFGVLKPDGGMLIADVPYNLSRFEDRNVWDQMKVYFKELNSNPNIRVDFKKDDSHWPTFLDYLSVTGNGTLMGQSFKKTWYCGTVRVLTGKKVDKRTFLLWGWSK